MGTDKKMRNIVAHRYGTVISSTLAAVLVAGSMAIPVFAASNLADDASTYSYNTGKQAYGARMAEAHPWFDNEDEKTTANYSFTASSILSAVYFSNSLYNCKVKTGFAFVTPLSGGVVFLS